jgi:aerobic carbon-monoxide dehydrogenase large subunit
MSTRSFGASIPRNIDDRLLTGRGRYTDDIELPGALHAAFVRSSFARARITAIDTSAACELPGVVAVYTWKDIGHLDQELPLLHPHPSLIGARTQRPLARDEVYHVGQTVAMVIAESRYLAEDALRLVDVDYEPLDVTIELEAASRPGAALVHEDVPDNVAAHFVQHSGDAAGAFARADHVTRITVRVERSCAAPLEGRTVAARWDRSTEQLTVWDGTQAPTSVRGGLASLFAIDEDRVRVIAPDVGGGFGQKVMFFYPEEILVPFAAMELDRPVKWIEDRVENFIGSTQERTQIHTIELAATRDGEVIGLRDFFLHDTGAFIPYGIAVAQVSSTSIAGPYRIPNIEVEFKAIYTPRSRSRRIAAAAGRRRASPSSGPWTSSGKSSASTDLKSVGAISSARTSSRGIATGWCSQTTCRSAMTAATIIPHLPNVPMRSRWIGSTSCARRR